MSDEILQAVEASNRAFAEFKARNDARLASLEALEAKMFNRPGNGGLGDPDGGESMRSSPELKGLDQFMRTGERKAMSAGSNPDGGYAVPREFMTFMESFALKFSQFRNLANVVQASTQDYHEIVNLRGQTSAWVSETAARGATPTPQIADVVRSVGRYIDGLVVGVFVGGVPLATDEVRA